MAYIYILRCENDELYVGSTIDINDRVVRHKSGRGLFTRSTTNLKS